MPTITDILPRDGVLLHLPAATMDAALTHISSLAAEVTGIRAPIIFAALHARTQQGVGLGGGVAIPHARVEGLKRIVAFFARPLAPIPMEDGDAVHLLFVLLAPVDAHGAHLKVLARVAALLRDPHARTTLEQGSKDAVYALLTGEG